METKELKITIPEGYEIDKKKSTFEKIVFKKKENIKPRSWEEYCYQQQEANNKGYHINDANCAPLEIHWAGCDSPHNWKNVLPSKELTIAFLAMMQLMSLREAWIGDWKPDWSYDNLSSYYCISVYMGKISIDVRSHTQGALSFPTSEMAKEFINRFEDLLIIAKPLI